ncbi:MAG TPA: serine hydrolase domain-containing protein [Azospirillaceae bacterium]|nr:serine hydrolase domain-containing protein [Azospirillaceae bacterium]
MSDPFPQLDAAFSDQIRDYMAAMGLPGLAVAVAVARRGDVRGSQRCFGMASLDYRVPVAPCTLFHLGSVGKHITAAAVLLLVEEGRISLDDPISLHVAGLPEAWRQASVRHCLTMTSGIPDYEAGFSWDRPHGRADVIARANQEPPAFAPGEGWRYSNTGYMLLGWLIEDVAGMPYPDLVRTRLLERAGLSRSRSDDAGRPIANRASPYLSGPGGFRHAVRPDGAVSAWPDGGILMAPAEFPAWHDALWGGRLVSGASLAALVEPVMLTGGAVHPYGMGVRLDPADDAVGHGGWIPGFCTHWLTLPAQDLGVLVTTNGEPRIMGSLAGVAALAAETVSPGSTWRGWPELEDADPDRTARLLHLVLDRSNMDHRWFAPEMAVRSAGDLTRAGVPDFSGHGRPDRVELVWEGAFRGRPVRRLRLAWGPAALCLSAGYTPDGRIAWTQVG